MYVNVLNIESQNIRQKSTTQNISDIYNIAADFYTRWILLIAAFSSTLLLPIAVKEALRN